ncbi:MAG: bifunctional folylpolyglutamate synthase/dihydrofolate synthase [Candidatus Marinimicrobia bacterium]|nr:bifunctional folylpolyglutamate synthase/dihydrofolate synthase [Candidatus Neomarinimicrobiota bacterium]
MNLVEKYIYNLKPSLIKPGLERIKSLLRYLGNPEKKLNFIHIAGTNGKGSTCALMYSILKSAGYKVGLYTSPHLVKYNERIRINDVYIPDDFIIEFINSTRKEIDKMEASFFEVTTALAFYYFKEMDVDFAVVETGMGGRWDATNVISPGVVVITRISKDHEKQLGKKVRDIAREKAGIIKKGAECVIGKQHHVVKKFLTEFCTEEGISFCYAPMYCKVSRIDFSIDNQKVDIHFYNSTIKGVKYPLHGRHQLENLATGLVAVSSAERRFGIKIDKLSFLKGIESVRWPGRLEIVHKNPYIFYDVGHNTSGIASTVRSMRELFPEGKIDVVLALKKTKRVKNIGKLLAILRGNIYIIAKSSEFYSFRDLKELIEKYTSEQKLLCSSGDLGAFLKDYVQNREGILLILGSHYIAQDVYSNIGNRNICP